MKWCKRETFQYWLAHIFIWIVTALPTLIFVLRVSHPYHEPNARSNRTHITQPRIPSNDENCRNYTVESCQVFSSAAHILRNITHVYDEEIVQILNGVFFPVNNSACSRPLQILLTVQKCVKCRMLSHTDEMIFQEFCHNCSNLVTNLSRKNERQLGNITCGLSGNLTTKNHTNEEKALTAGNKTCPDLLIMDKNGSCQIPCDWSFMSSSVRKIFYGVMVLNMWLGLVAVVIVIGTLATFKPMRTFPHILRFYILTSSVLYATASLLPLRIGLAKVYCSDDKFWNEEGHFSMPTVLEGATTHYFFLTFCFWSCCYVVNTYFVIVRNSQNIFHHKTKYHILQFLFCSTLPALLVGTNLAVKPPGYKALFLDRMSSVFTSPVVEYMTFTLPIQITLGIAISLLWSLIRFVRKVRKNKTTVQAIRSGDDTTAFMNAEKQFTKLAFLFIITVAVVLSSEIIITYQNEEYIHQVEKYFECLKDSSNCHKPAVQIFFLSSVKISGPGVFCVFNFFLLFFNKDTRDVWKKWFWWIYAKVMCKGNKYLQERSTTRSNMDDIGTRPRSATTETNTSLNSTSLLNPNYFKPINLRQIAMSSTKSQHE